MSRRRRNRNKTKHNIPFIGKRSTATLPSDKFDKFDELEDLSRLSKNQRKKLRRQRRGLQNQPVSPPPKTLEDYVINEAKKKAEATKLVKIKNRKEIILPVKPELLDEKTTLSLKPKQYESS